MLALIVGADESQPNNNGVAGKLLYLRAAAFEETLRPHRLALVLFKDSQNACDKCPELLAALERAAPQLAALNPPVVVGFFNTNEDAALTMRYGISQTPTLKMFRKGEELLRDYNGATDDADDIVAYLTKHAEQPSLELTTLDEAQSVVPNKDGSGGVVVFGFFKKVDYDLIQLMEAEDELRDVGFVRCVHATTDEIMNFYGRRHTFVVFNPERPEPAVWNVTEGISVTSALEFIANNSIPLVGTYDKITKTLYNRLDRPLLRVFVDTDEERNGAQLRYIRRRLQQLAPKFPRVMFTIASPVGAEKLLTELQYTPEQVRAGAAVAVTQQQSRWRPSGALNAFAVAPLEEFLLRFTAGGLRPYLRSQPIPTAVARPGDGRVIEVVGQTFHDVVLDRSRDVLLMVHAHWCGGCIKSMPAVEEAAAHFKGDATVVVAKIDGSENEVPYPYGATSYPTIYFSRRDQKGSTAIPFDGDRTAANLIEFIKRHRSPRL